MAESRNSAAVTSWLRKSPEQGKVLVLQSEIWPRLDLAKKIKIKQQWSSCVTLGPAV